MEHEILINKARIADVPHMLRLIDRASKEGHVLPRSMSYLYDNVRDFWVAKDGDALMACGSLHICWEGLAEIKSLVVEEAVRRKGLGTTIVRKCVDEAVDLGIAEVFVLTYLPDYFEAMGFHRVDKSALPHKVWQDCINCPKFPNCEEVALIRRLEAERD